MPSFRAAFPFAAHALNAALLCAAALCILQPARAAEVPAAMLRYPDVSAEHIVFVYDNDVWIAPKEGGSAWPLSSPAGAESFPRFSPDGRRVAFSAAYEGNTDVYELPIGGGTPRRLSYQPYGARVVDYAPDGRVVYETGDVATAESQLWYADPQGGLPERLALKYGDMASFSADGEWIAYTPWRHIWQDGSWNRYQGGQDADVWTFNLKTLESRAIADWPGTDDVPMVHGETVFYLSDRGPEHRRNIWSCDLRGEKHTQITHFKNGEVRWPAIGPSDIVFQQAGRLWLLPLSSLQPRRVEISLSGDRRHLQPYTHSEAGMPQAWSMSPGGKRLAVESHGDIWSIPGREGVQYNLTPTDGFAERDPHWSPDGKWIAYVSDQSGMYEIWLRPADEEGEARQLTQGSPQRMFWLNWSPDSRYLLCLDRSSTYFVVNAETGAKTVLATDHYGAINAWTGWASLSAAWAPDSRWVALVLSDVTTRNGVIHLVNIETLEKQAVTSPLVPCSFPAFDQNGELLYFSTDQSYSPVFSDQEDYDANYVFANSSRLAALTLRRDVKSPLLPINQEEERLPAETAAPETAPAPTAAPPADPPAAPDTAPAAPEAAQPLKIDFEGIAGRIIALPLPAGNISALAAGRDKLFYLRWPNAGTWGPPELHMLDIAMLRSGTPTGLPGPDGRPGGPDFTLLSGVWGYQLSPDASLLAVSANGGLFITAAAPGAALDKPVPLPERLKSIDPRSEWRQVIFENWRAFKEKFYDPGLHGVDWDGARDRALALLPYVSCREDFGFVLAEMNAELNVGHTYVWSAGSDWASGYGLGLLGCDFERASDSAGRPGIRFGRIYRSADGELDTRSPLLTPGVDVREGQFLLAINEQPVQAGDNPYRLLLGQAGRTVKLSVGDSAVRDDSTRELLINALGWDGELRHRAWVEDQRRYVAQKSGGRLGYIHVRNTSNEGRIDLQRQLNSQCNSEALIIDERYNGGGSLPLRFIDLLREPAPVYVKTHYGAAGRAPSRRPMAPKVMLINQYAGSCGDLFPFLFRQAGLGPLIGVRTWGGLVGLSGGESYLDGSGAVVPSLGVYSLAGDWIAEGYGVDPDIEVVNDPTSVSRGYDPQLDAAIAEALRLADEEPFRETPPPAYRDKSGVRTER
ncbi:PD40 domain-containing protein [bacterium]|nr:PD40 domain-containing protein [bacterium]